MNIDNMLKYVCKKRGIPLDAATQKALKKEILKEDVHLTNIMAVINVILDEAVEAFNKQESSMYNKVFKVESSDHSNCPVCKQVMTEVKLANDRETEFCNKCKVVMPYPEKK